MTSFFFIFVFSSRIQKTNAQKVANHWIWMRGTLVSELTNWTTVSQPQSSIILW